MTGHKPQIALHAMKQTLQFKLSQHLALTPQLQQSIRLLQLSTLELNQEIEQVLADNPMLERADDLLASPLRVSADGSINYDHAAQENTMPSSPPSTDAPVAEAGADGGGEAGGGEADFGEGQDWTFDDYARRSTNNEDDDAPQQQLCEASPSLREHLMQQLILTQLSMRDRGLITMIIEALDEDGYLTQPLEEIAEIIPEELEVEPEELSAALKMLQSFDPIGIGARTPSECLLLQLNKTLPGRIRELAEAICTKHLELLAARDYAKLKKLLSTTDNDLKQAHDLIRSLNPFPGASFGKREADYIVPDVIARKTKQGWTAILNSDVMPRLRVNEMYAKILRANRAESRAEARAAGMPVSKPEGNGAVGSAENSGAQNLHGQLQEAKWLIKNVQQRFDTILRVSQAIIDRQRNFFTHGAVAMRPLVLREIADTLGLHESTISRVTTQKYMLTPFGTFELKYFFGSHVATEAGGSASSTAIRALIKQLIGAEDTKNPLSDSKIADMLGEQGIVVARRTVAKYREALRIPAVNLRKSL